MNEGILDFFKTVFKQEWKSIKSKSSVIKQKLEKIDQGLSGFSLMKLKNSSKCNDIRQAICDFANDLLDSKMKELKDGKKLKETLMGVKDKDNVSDRDKEKVKNLGDVSKFMQQFHIKDKALAEKLKTNEEKIKTLCENDPNLIKWSNLLKNDIRNVVNDIIIQESDAEDKEQYDKIVKEQQKEEQKKIDDAEKEAKKNQEEALKTLENERNKALSDVGVTPLRGETGDKAIQELHSAFDKILSVANELKEAQGGGEESEKEGEGEGTDGKTKPDMEKIASSVKNAIETDTHFGLKTIIEVKTMEKEGGDGKEDGEKGKPSQLDIFKNTIAILEPTFKAIEDTQKKTKLLTDCTSDAVQALYVGVTCIVGNVVSGNTKELGDSIKNLLARCAIDSDKTIGYGCPLLDENKPKEGNIFINVTNKLANGDDIIFKGLKDSAQDTNKFNEFMANFKRGVSKIFDLVKTQAENLKKEKEKKDADESKKTEQEENK